MDVLVHFRGARAALLIAAFFLCGASWAQPSTLAPGFDRLPPGARVVLLTPNLAIAEVDMDNVLTPQPEWARTIAGHFRQLYLARGSTWKIQFVELASQDEAAFADLQRLNEAVGAAIEWHHFGDRKQRLTAKKGELDWSIGQSAAALKQRTGADYALFTVVLDFRPTDARELVQSSIALISLGAAAKTGASPAYGMRLAIAGRLQNARVTLVELNTGRIVWASFPLWWSSRQRGTYDFRERDQAEEAIDVLFREFPR